eukprot:1595373-Prymnesium_polylepis.1
MAHNMSACTYLWHAFNICRCMCLSMATRGVGCAGQKRTAHRHYGVPKMQVKLVGGCRIECRLGDSSA